MDNPEKQANAVSPELTQTELDKVTGGNSLNPISYPVQGSKIGSTPGVSVVSSDPDEGGQLR